MRFLTGLVVGIMLTVGGTYIADAMHSAPGADARPAAQMVNWSVVNDNLRGFSSDVQSGWDKLVGTAKQLDRKSGI